MIMIVRTMMMKYKMTPMMMIPQVRVAEGREAIAMVLMMAMMLVMTTHTGESRERWQQREGQQ